MILKLIGDLSTVLGFEHSSFVFAQEANMHENRFNEYRIPSGMLIVFLEKALTLIHMETHLDDVSIYTPIPQNPINSTRGSLVGERAHSCKLYCNY